MPARIPQSFIDELITRTDIVELINGYVALQKKGKEYMACCPFHDEKTASFSVSPDKQFYHCFGCGAHGTALGFLMEYEHLEFIEAIESLAQDLGLEVPRDETAVIQDNHQELFTLLEQANAYYKKMLQEHKNAIDYLKARGLSGEIAAKFGLGFAPDGFDNVVNQFKNAATQEQLLKTGLIKKNEKGSTYDRFRSRIVFPIKDRRGRVLGFGGRALGDAQPKYLNSPETPVFHKSEALYGLYEARKAKETTRFMLVVEGYMDVIALSQHGIENVVATLGTATTAQHIRLLYRCTKNIMFCFDGDRAGRDAAWRAAQQTIPLFKDGLDVKFLFLPQGEDPDSLIRSRGKKVFLQYLEDSEPLSTFIFNKLSENIDIRTAAGKAQFAQIAKPILEKFPGGVFKRVLFAELEKKIGVPVYHATGSTLQDKPNPSKTLSSKVTPVRLAIAALLHQPALAAEVRTIAALDKSSAASISLLVKIITIFKQEPALSPAALIERFRDQEADTHLQKLLVWKPPELADPKQAFTDAMAWVYRKSYKERVQKLIDKEATDGLNEDERIELRDLLHQKLS